MREERRRRFSAARCSMRCAMSAFVLLTASTADARAVDWMEIGTNNFDTLLQTAMDGSVGVSVEAMRFYLDQLPSKEGVTKVNAAVVRSTGNKTATIFYIPVTAIKEHRLPWWLKGCNSIGAPHPKALEELGRRGLMSLLVQEAVPALTFEEIVMREAITAIGYLKVDVEGFDGQVVRSVVDACKWRPSLWPRVLTFEREHLPAREVRLLRTLLSNHRYIELRTPNQVEDKFNIHFVRL